MAHIRDSFPIVSKKRRGKDGRDGRKGRTEGTKERKGRKEERDRKERKKRKDGRTEGRKKKDGLSRNLEPVLRFYKSGHISVRSTWCPLYVLSEFGQVHVTLLGQSLMQGECLLQCMAGLTLFGNLQVVPHELLVVRMHAVLDDTLGALGR